MAVVSSSEFDYLVAFNLHTCGSVGDELGSDESDIILIAWTIVDAKQNTVRVQSHTSESRSICWRVWNAFLVLRHFLCLAKHMLYYNMFFEYDRNVMPAVLCEWAVN